MSSMKRSINWAAAVSLLFLTGFTAFSCSNNTAVNEEAFETLRTEAQSLEDSMKWTIELEPDTLKQRVSGADGMDRSLVASGTFVFASGAESEYPRIYPKIEGFANLDVSKYEDSDLTLVKGFCRAVTAGEDADAFINKDSLYTLVLFRYDLLTYYGNSKPPFTSYLIGEPFINENVYQCPVRFLQKSGKGLDVCLYLDSSGKSRKISQIVINGGVEH